ncbi:hypothetical protein yfred0001_36000 [Yersinia frederiksenii ATCC 33641]|nr:hypothetical protein yfred0001_36000 [Yersinia frederiksenii ATCC 33641]
MSAQRDLFACCLAAMPMILDISCALDTVAVLAALMRRITG